MKREDINISVLGDTLAIKGERKAEEKVKKENYYLCERCYGSFERSINLPAAIDSSKIEAEFKDGMLEIKLPKTPEAKPKKLEIKVK
jgi:HSP20 family protein